MKTGLSRVGGFSKKKKILLIVSIVLFVLFAVSGGYLLWRVKQPETIAPEEGEAYGPGDCPLKDGPYDHIPLSLIHI